MPQGCPALSRASRLSFRMGWSQSQRPERGMGQGPGCPAPFRDQEGQWGDPGTVPKGSQLQHLSLGQGRASCTHHVMETSRDRGDTQVPQDLLCTPNQLTAPGPGTPLPLAGSAPTSSLPCPGADLWEALHPLHPLQLIYLQPTYELNPNLQTHLGSFSAWAQS